jgi:hypothetical protein
MKKISLLILLIATCFVSCQKEATVQTEQEEFDYRLLISANLDYLDYPVLQNNILKFRDHEHYFNFVEELEEIETNCDVPGSTDTVSFEEKLNAIETHIGFVSVRKQFYLDYEAQNEIGWASFDQIPSLDIPLDDITLSLLNEDMNIIVGDTLFNYFNDSTLLKVYDATTTNIDVIRDANGQLPNLE